MRLVGILFRLALVFVACLSSCLVAPSFAQGAEITLDPSRGASGAVFEGKIEKGDFDKLRNFLLNNGAVHELYLASPGGDLAEAIKLGLLVRSLELATVIPSKIWTNQERQLAIARHNLKNAKTDYMCVSACFFVFIGGIYRSKELDGPPLLGIHRPALSKDDVKRLSLEEANAAIDQTKTIVENYLRFMGISRTYADAMYAVPKDRIHWIAHEDFDRDFAGFIPALRDWVATACRTGADPACERKVQEGLASHAHDEMLKMRDGKLSQPTLDGLLVAPPK